MVQSTRIWSTSPACTQGRARFCAWCARIFCVSVIGLRSVGVDMSGLLYPSALACAAPSACGVSPPSEQARTLVRSQTTVPDTSASVARTLMKMPDDDSLAETRIPVSTPEGTATVLDSVALGDPL